MAHDTVFLVETLMFEGAALAFGVWQFWSVRPDRKAKGRKPPAAGPASPGDPGHPEGQHGLDDG